MFTNGDVLRLERQLRSAEPRLKTLVLRQIGRLSPDARAALFAVHNTAWSPLLLGSLLATETGAALDAASVERVAVETLAHALGGRSVARRRAARIALVHGNVSLAPAQPILERLARDQRVAVRAAVGAVFSWGTRLDTSDVALVEEMLRDPWLRGARTNPPSTWEPFLRALDDPAAEVQSAAAETLRHSFREVPGEVLARLGRLARSRSAMEVRVTAAHSVAHLAKGDDAAIEEATASLVSGLRARDAKVRLVASYALSCLGELAVSALPDLLRIAKSDPDFNVRARALWAFRSMGPRARRAAPLLRRLLRDSDANIRRFAGEALAAVQGESSR
jgi:hypothetical protein